MNVGFERFAATDGVELQGWYSDAAGDTAVVHVHGMSGNGYENNFLDELRTMYNEKGLGFFSIDTRGRGVVSDFRQGEGTKRGGSCYELFDESLSDIEGAMRHLQETAGKARFVLEGHSLGGSKVVNYALATTALRAEALVLLAPTDMVGWAGADPQHEAYMRKAKQLTAAGKGEELVGAQCWLDGTPISAQTYPTICETGSSADIYGSRPDGPSLLGRVSVPMLVMYGTQDIGILEIDGTEENWLRRVNPGKHPHTEIEFIHGAGHGFRDHEATLSHRVASFIGRRVA
jgi:pimeloyl-ACP methyl ester carboxylesterase